MLKHSIDAGEGTIDDLTQIEFAANGRKESYLTRARADNG